MGFQNFMIFLSLTEIACCGELLNCKNLNTHKNFHLLPTKATCGEVVSRLRIMGGKNAELGQYPWMAVLLKKNGSKENNLDLFCGGSVINDKYVITAAHCVNWEFKVENIVVRLGEHDMSKILDCKRGKCANPLQEHKIEEIFKHQKFDQKTRRDVDIGLVRVQGKIVFDKYVQAICLPTTCVIIENQFFDQTLTACGWGGNFDFPKVRRTSVLQVVSFKSVSMDVCKKNWPNLKINVEKQICAGGSSVGVKGKDSCRGDSGGPLMFLNDRDGTPVHFVLVGIVAEGQTCQENADFQPAGIYTRVGAFMNWILDHIRA